MLLLGVVQAQAAGAPAGAGSYDLLQTEILTGNQASVTFSSLGDYATDYQHLQLRYTARTSRLAAASILYIQYNGDTAANYSSHWLLGNGSTVTSSAVTSTAAPLFSLAADANLTADVFAGGTIDILDPFNSSKNTTARSLSGVAPNFVMLGSQSWRNTNALTSIEIKPEANDFVSESRFSLYGLKASV
jgi:hypothetical protein